ncbi:MAG TPA: cation:proton antiporter [Pseudomonadales bacterium]
MEGLTQIIVLLAVAVTVVAMFQRLRIPTSLGYLLVGVILGPYTAGPSLDRPELRALAEFGVVFLLFTIGLNYSLPQLAALRGQVFGHGTSQVVLTTIIVAVLMWLIGLPPAVSFVIGAVFAQSSSTVIASILGEQGELHTPHGRLGLALSVFQDVTAVPFIVIIPVLGIGVSATALTGALGWAMAKAVFAFLLVFFAGRWLLRPLFRFVTARRSPELFTLTVLLVALLAAWSTNYFGLSLAFGAFLGGMMLGETEFRHQVESSISPFRDVLLGLFFMGIGMLLDPAAIPDIWHWALLGALLMLVTKTVLVAALLRGSGFEALMSWRTGLILSVGGEFGLALIAIALTSNVLDATLGQVVLTTVLFAMIGGALLIRFNHAIASRFSKPAEQPALPEKVFPADEQTVLIAGYGRVGHTVAVLLKDRDIPFLAFDTDLARVMQGRRDGHQVLYGDASDPGLLRSIHVERAALIVVTVDDPPTAMRLVSIVRQTCPHVPVIARARDLKASAELRNAGAMHAFPEAIEASLRLGSLALELLNVPKEDVEGLVQGIRDWNYRPVIEPAEKA